MTAVARSARQHNAQSVAQRNRGTVFIEEGILEETTVFDGNQFAMKLRAPKCAASARPGNFVHLTCDPSTPMRRPLSIMRVVGECIEILYKVVGRGSRQLARRKIGDAISLIGPIGVPFQPAFDRSMPLLIGGGVGIPPMIFLADFLRQRQDRWQATAFLGSELPFPFAQQLSSITTPWLANDIDRTMPLLESWEIPCRLATLSDFEGCFAGYVTDLAEKWLTTLTKNELAKVQVFSCGPTPMLKAVTKLAARYELPCQVSLEEFMACAVGGCAGCTVLIETPDGPGMKRVCVDGPVFDAATVRWQ